MEGTKAMQVDEAKIDRTAKVEVPSVTWWKDGGLRRLYCMMPILFLGSTINGYDGSLLNGLQTMEPWQECEFMTDQRVHEFTEFRESRLLFLANRRV